MAIPAPNILDRLLRFAGVLDVLRGRGTAAATTECSKVVGSWMVKWVLDLGTVVSGRITRFREVSE